MKTAVISDIHGNLHALEAVLADAEKLQVEKYVFLGDYYMDLPFPNEVVDRIKGLDAVVVRGNKEDYLPDGNPDRGTRTFKMMASLYWNYDKLTRENYDYLTNLPVEVEFKIGGQYASARHVPNDFFKNTAKRVFGSQIFYGLMLKKPFTHDEYLERAKRIITKSKRIATLLDNYKDGAYIFGHTHVQWHFIGGGKLLLNPGSCGMALDFDNTAAYSIIEWDGEWTVEERRVVYDIQAAATALKASELWRVAPVWSGIIEEHLMFAEDHVSFLIDTAFAVQKDFGESGLPFSNKVWERAGEVYKECGVRRVVL